MRRTLDVLSHPCGTTVMSSGLSFHLTRKVRIFTASPETRGNKRPYCSHRLLHTFSLMPVILSAAHFQTTAVFIYNSCRVGPQD